MSNAEPRSARTTVRYGLDAPPVVAVFAALAVVGCVFLALTAWTPAPLLGPGLAFLIVGVGTTALMVHSSLRGKVLLRDRVLDELELAADADVVDLGTGRGLMLLGAAMRTPRGTGTGVDLWHSRDQAGSSPQLFQANADALKVADRVHVITADMTAPPLADESADVVLACLAIHNIRDRQARRAAITEAFRILHSGGRLAIIDFAKTDEYVQDARDAGFVDVTRSRPTPLMWPPVRVVTARKP